MKIGLALSGGGVLGAAHIGLLEEIEKNNIKIYAITGASSGAIIGALFAEGGTKKIYEFIDDLSGKGLFSKAKLVIKLHPDNVFNEIRSALKRHLKSEKFYDLPIKFAALATDIDKGIPEVIKNGDLIDALAASAAYPGVFPVQNINGKFLIDGGITRNLPAETVREMGAQFVIGSSLYNVGKLTKFNKDGKLTTNRIDIALRSIDIMQKALADLEIKNCDFCFCPPVENFAWFNFDKMESILEIGKQYASCISPKLLKSIAAKDHPSLWKNLLGLE